MDSYKDKFFLWNYVTYTIIGNYVLVSNEYKTSYIRVPIEFFELLKYSYYNKIKMNDLFNYISLELKDYFILVLKSLEKMELLNSDIGFKFRTEFIPKVVISVTNRCNLSCSYCCMDSGVDFKDDISTDELKDIFTFSVGLKPNYINISGGEPLMRVGILEELEYLRNIYDGYINLSTNAILINTNNIDRLLASIDQITITLDGYDEFTCSLIRGKNTFYKVVDTIKNIKEKGFNNIVCSMVVGEQTEKNVEKFKKICNKLNVKYQLNTFMRIGKGEQDKYFLSNPSYVDYISPYDYTDDNKANSCRAGENQIFIDCKGNVFPCPLLTDDRYLIGNIFKDRNIDILKSEKKEGIIKLLDENRSAKNKKCRNCEFNLFCIKCMYVMYFMNKDKRIFSENCKRRKVIQNQVLRGVKNENSDN